MAVAVLCRRTTRQMPRPTLRLSVSSVPVVVAVNFVARVPPCFR